MHDRADLLVCGDHVLPMTDGLPVLADAAVAVRGRDIVAVGPRADLERAHPGADRISGGIVLPGLVNTHGHAAMTVYRGLMDDVPLHEWLVKYVWPAEKRFTSPENVALGTELAVAEMFASGTTTFADMYFFENEVGRVCAEAGMRVLLGQAVLAFETPDAPSADASIETGAALAAKYGGHPLVSVSLALHAVYTVPPEKLRKGAAMAAKWDVPIQIHVSESRREVADCVAAHGVTPPRLLADTGVLRKGTICAHGVHLTEEDRALIRDAGAGVSLNPESNLKLGSGVPDIAALLASGMRLGLGTDGAASNNDLDLWDAVRLAALLPKGRDEDPTAVPAREAVRLATRGGAELLSMGDRIGTLEAGKRADLCVVDTSSPHMTPLFDPYAHLAYGTRGSDVVHTVVDGRVVYRDRRHATIDAAAVAARVRALAPRIAESAGLRGPARR
ncbi:MAG: 5-methylthioadenosine/S-adenosylhomocysteine deaminase [Planctomycetes bacterium]|nr:5-methylthioadenosine/S-adenosylhomocysteine deaminase [Planctomycetota bacterium]